MTKKRILIDGREFTSGKMTGIGRFLSGLIDALAVMENIEIVLAVTTTETIPAILSNCEKITIEIVRNGFVSSEKMLSQLTNECFRLLISPYPKLPLFGSYCPSVHTVHDVHDLTHPSYNKRLRVFFDKYRLKSALKKAVLTWYDSDWSLQETKRFVGFAGAAPTVRFPAIGDQFKIENDGNEASPLPFLNSLPLKEGYILVTGNGMPHKNLGILLSVSNSLSRELLFVGVSEHNRLYWMNRYPHARATWINYLDERALPDVIKNAFCLALPSAAEGYGYPALEAMACGIPVVISRIPVLIETTGGNALIADPLKPQQWADAFQALENKIVYFNQIEKGLIWTKPLRGRPGWKNHVDDVEKLISGE